MYAPDAVLTPEEAASAAGVPVWTLLHAPVPRSYLTRKTVRFLWRNVAAWLEEHEPQGTTAPAQMPTPLVPQVGAYDRGSVLYVLHCAATGLVKIGITGDLRERVKTLQYAAGVPLAVLLHKPMPRSRARAREESLHARFAADRKLGEWFTFSPAIRSWLATEGVANA